MVTLTKNLMSVQGGKNKTPFLDNMDLVLDILHGRY